MTPLQQARQWIADQAPSTEEIQQSIDNLCHIYARPPQGVGHGEVFAAISFLMTAIGGNVDEIVLPDKISAGELDTGPLGRTEEEPAPREVACLSPDDRKRRFEDLKASFEAPF